MTIIFVVMANIVSNSALEGPVAGRCCSSVSCCRAGQSSTGYTGITVFTVLEVACFYYKRVHFKWNAVA